MKNICNWRNATVADCESDGLIRQATKIHILSYKLHEQPIKSIQGDNHPRIKAFLQHHIDNYIPIVGHNFICFDIPLLEKILNIDLSKLMVIDSLSLSWYLNTSRSKHGLGSFLEDYGVAKPEVDDWINPPYELMIERCEEDVKINSLLWTDLRDRLSGLYTLSKEQVNNGNVGGKRISETEVIYLDSKVGQSVEVWVNEILTFLNFKMDCARLQEATGFDLDEELLDKSIEELTAKFDESRTILESVMPKVVKYKDKKAPAKGFKKNGDRSASGESWDAVMKQYDAKELTELGHPMVLPSEKDGYIQIFDKYEEPNANSPQQVKDFLFSKGWVPQTFKYVRDKVAFEVWAKSQPEKGSKRGAWSIWKESKPQDREVPQTNVDGDEGKELCHSLEELAEQIPEIKVYAEYSTLKHRLGTLNGFKTNAYEGKLQARIGGYTNTLRMQHKEICNLPSASKPYGSTVRDVLIASEGYKLIGSDLSSLEDRVKNIFLLAHDPEFVETMMTPGFDPHILNALAADLITQEEFDDFKKGIKPDHVIKARQQGKGCTYSAAYGGGAGAIARAADVSLEVGAALHKAYWEINSGVKAIADDQCIIKDASGGNWLINPINGFCYSLRGEKDRFSTLCQGLGAFIFDSWLDFFLEDMQETFGKKTLTHQEHDSLLVNIKDKPKAIAWVQEALVRAIDKVNSKYKLRVQMGIDNMVGYRLTDTH
jgi:hypothetical protein